MKTNSFIEQPRGFPFDSTDFAMNGASTEATFVQPATPNLDEWEEVDEEDSGTRVEVDAEEVERFDAEDDEQFEQYMLGDEDD